MSNLFSIFDAEIMPPKRPTTYTPELARQICSKLASSSDGLVKICRDNKFPHHSTVLQWLADEDKSDFLKSYQLAREAQADVLTDEIIEIADDMDSTEDSAARVSRARLRIDARKWKAAKLAPKKYGDRLSQNIAPAFSGEEGNIIVWAGQEIRI